MSVIRYLKKFVPLLVAAGVLQTAGAVHAYQMVELLGVNGKKTTNNPGVTAARTPAANPSAASSGFAAGGSVSTLTKQYHHHRYLAEQSLKRLQRLEWEYRNGGGFIPAQVAVYREKVKQAYAAEKAVYNRELAMAGDMQRRISAAQAAARTNATRPTTAPAPSSSSPRIYVPTSPRADDYNPGSSRPTTEGYGGFTPRPAPRPAPTMPSPILLPGPRPKPGSTAAATPRPTPRPNYTPRPDPIPVTLPPGRGSMPLNLVAPTGGRKR
jgi:hypothetical protein